MAKQTDIGVRCPGIAQSIERMILDLGGTSSHVAAKVTLPEMAFDALIESMSRGNAIAKGSDAVSIFGVMFERGDSDAVIRERAMARNGLTTRGRCDER